MRTGIVVTLGALTLGMIVGCSDRSGPESTSSNDTGWMLGEEPAGAVSVVEAKATAKEGETVVVRGRIGGRKTPISSESPVFTIVNLEVPHCGQMGEEDHCPTPWDYCCETPEDLRANSATVQLVGDGESAIDPTAGGLAGLDEVVVVGTVGPRPSQDVLTIRATSVFRR